MGPLLFAILTAAPAANGVAPSRPAGAVRLVVERGTGAESCPSEEELKAAVVRRIGFDPFKDEAERQMRCLIRRGEGSFQARIEVATGEGSPAGGRELISRRDDCGELAEAIELAVGTAITPLSASRLRESLPLAAAPEPTAPPAAVLAQTATAISTPAQDDRPPLPEASTAPANSAMSAVPRPPAAPAASAVTRGSAPHARDYAVGIRASVAGALGLGPGPTPGLGIGASLRRRALSLDVEGRIIGESSVAVASGSATAWLWNASVGPCYHRRYVAACVVGTAGALRAHGNGFATIAQANAPYVAVAGRGVLEIPIGERLSLRWAGEIAAPLVTIHLTVDGHDVWTSPRVSVLSTFGLGVNFH